MGGQNPIARTIESAKSALGKDTRSSNSGREASEPPSRSYKPAHEQPPDYVAPKDDSDMSELLEALPDLVKKVQQEPQLEESRGVPASVGLRDEGIIRSAFRELATPEAMAVITNVTRTQAAIILKQAVQTRELNMPFMQLKWDQLADRMPATMRLVAKSAAGFTAALVLGLFLAVWRFVLFGLK